MNSENKPYHLSEDGKVLLSVDDVVDLVIPEGIETIGEHAFSFLTMLKSIAIPESVTTIERFAFADSGIESLFLPKSVTSIGTECFSGCVHLGSIEVDKDNSFYSSVDGVLYDKRKHVLVVYPAGKVASHFEVDSGVRSIGACAFEGSTLVTVHLPESVNEIGERAFAFCRNLSRVNIPVGVVAIGDLTFLNCELLEEVVLPEGLETLGGCSFFGCHSLSSIWIPSSVSFIDEKAFEGCAALSDIICEVSVPASMEVNERAFDESLLGVCTLRVPMGSEVSYRSHPVFKLFGKIEGNNA